MSDLVNSGNDLETLVSQYEDGIANRESTDVAKLLDLRDRIESQYSDLSAEQAERVEEADADMTKNAGMFAASLAANGTPLRELRAKGNHAPEQWWWYLDVLSHVSDEIGSGGQGRGDSSTASKIITVVELLVLGVAIVLLLLNSPNLISRFFPQTTPTPTIFPSWTPAPSPTFDVAAFDLTSATVAKANNDIVEVSLPKGWKAAPEQQAGNYSYSLGDEQNPIAALQVSIGSPTTIYSQALGMQTVPASPKDALEQLKKSANPSFKFGDVVAAKISTYDAQSLSVNIPSQGGAGEARQFDLRIATIDPNNIVFVVLQSNQGISGQAMPVLQKMVETMKLNIGNIPTPTPSNTPHPLELTSTAIENMAATNRAQIIALTPTATSAGTEAATQGATDAATPAATSQP